MINPVIFRIFGWPVHWYGLIVMSGVVLGALIAEREIKRRGENGEAVWDSLFWILIPAFVGARLWYIANDILGGNTAFIDDPITMLYIWKGGIHFFGGLLFGGIALYFFLKQNGMDVWLFLDAIGPAALIGQAIGRIGNFINQELYGPPTKLLWGLKIYPDQPFQTPVDMIGYTQQEVLDFIKVTRFHPTFAYEMTLNILAALLLLWISRQYKDKMKPGVIFAGWLISAGLIRTFVEFFRPDQPRIGDSFVTYSMLVSFLMAIAGVVMLLVRYGKLQLTMAEGWEEEYHIKAVPEKKPRTRATTTAITPAAMNEKVASKKSANAVPASTRKTTVAKKTTTKKTAAKPKSTKPKTSTLKTKSPKTTKLKTTKK